MPGFWSTYSPMFLVLFFVVSAAVSYWFYRNSQLSKVKKYTLIALKTSGIFLLLALFTEPVLTLIVKNDDKKSDLILIDNSRSMLTGSKTAELSDLIESNKLLQGDFNVFSFSDGVTVLSSADSLNTDGFATDLSGALKKIRENYPDRVFNSVTVISDGIFNTGINPIYEAKTMQAPFITFAIGDTVQQKDISVINTAYNEYAFTNTPVQVKVFINVYEFPGQTINVNLYREGSLISAKSITQASDITSYETEFTITELNEGKIKYRIEAEHKDGEYTYKNNHTEFYITFTDNKVNMLVISGAPGYDNEFTGSVLKRIGNYNITYKTSKNQTEFYEGAINPQIYPELSVIFLLNYPTNQTGSEQLNTLYEKAKMYNIPVLLFAGKNTDYQKLSILEDFLPFSAGRTNSSEVQFNMQITGSADNPLNRIDGFNSTAQIFRNISGIMPKPGAITYATDKSSGEPVFITRRSEKNKSTAFLGYGLWRWRLNRQSDALKTLESFLLESVNMTLQKEKKTKFRVYPVKDFFDYKERVKISADVFDENYLPSRNAKVTGVIKDKSGNKITELEFNTYENSFTAITSEPLPVNDYYIEASSETGGVYYSAGISRFTVDTLNREFRETRTDVNSLKELSGNTGGEFISGVNNCSIRKILEQTKNPLLKELNAEKIRRFNLWDNAYVLALIILIFAAEWVVRKRNNLA